MRNTVTAFGRIFWKRDALQTKSPQPQVSFLGRLKNRPELISQLGLEVACTDEDIIIAAFNRWQTACASHLRGAFAFVMANRDPTWIFAARDPSGQQPLYYVSTSEGFRAAQSIKELEAEPGLGTLNEDRVACWLHRPSSFRAETFFKEIHKLPPGHILVGASPHLTVSRYWQPENLEPHQVSHPEDLWKAYADVLRQSVVDSMGTGNLGCHASGGIDSTAVYMWAQEACSRTGRDLTGYSWHPPPPPTVGRRKNEYDQVDILADYTTGTLQHCPIDEEALTEVLSQDVTLRPWMLANVMLTERTVQQAAQRANITTLLSGWGGDEIASQHYGTSFRQHCLHNGKFKSYWQSLPVPRSGRQILRDGLTLVGLKPRSGARKKNRDYDFLHPDWQERVSSISSADIFPPSCPLNPLPLHYWNHGHLSDRTEAYFDSGRDFGLRYAHPLLDQEVMEFALRIPLQKAVNPNISRWPFRQAISGIVPPEITWARSKREPLRVEAARQTTAKALAEIGHTLRTKPTQPKRSSFFDMPKLLRALEPSALNQSSHHGRLLRAISFLDF